MKKIFSILIAMIMLFSVSACKNPDNDIKDNVSDQYITKLAKSDLQERLYNDEEYEQFLLKVKDFSYELSEQVYKYYSSDDNFTISPISIYMALAMATEVTAGQTQAELFNALGLSYDEISTYTKYLFSEANDEYFGKTDFENVVSTGFEDLRNSIWVDDELSLNENVMSSLADNFYTTTYKVPFQKDKKKAEEALRSYIKSATRGLIDKKYELSNEVIFMLVNTYYLKDIWNDYGEELHFTKASYDFINKDGSVSVQKLLEGYYFSGKPYQTLKYSTATTNTVNGFKLKFIVPNDGYSVNDVFTSEILKEANNVNNYLAVDDEKREYNHTKCLFPEFEASYDEDLKNVLEEQFGIRKLFDPNLADFSNLIESQAYIGSVKHQTKLIVNRTGIEGAAVTIMQACGAAGPGPYENIYHQFVVNKAFVFMITDSKDNVLFSGVVNKI